MIQPLFFKNLVELLPHKVPTPEAASLTGEKIKRFCHIPEIAWSIPSHPGGIRRQCNVEFCKTIFPHPNSTILHVTVRNNDWESLEQKFIKIHKIGVRNILVIHGDPPPEPALAKNFLYVDLDTVDVIKKIKTRLNKGTGFTGASLEEPTAFRVGCAVNLTPQNKAGRKKEPHFQMERLHKKITAGADFVISQPIFDSKQAFHFLHLYAATYGDLNNIPFYCGILPITSPKDLKSIANIPEIEVPPIMAIRLQLAGDKYRFRQFSLDCTLEICSQMEPIPSAAGFHFSAPSGDLSMIEEVITQRALQNKPLAI